MIISPWFFYIMQLSDGFRNCLVTVGIIAVVIGIMVFIDNSISNTSIPVKRWFAIGVVLLLIAQLMPSKDTLLLMKASEFVTYDNVQLTVDAFKSAIDYAASIVQ